MAVLTASYLRAREILGVSQDADKATIKRAYRKKTLEHPPDQDPEGFRGIRESYEVLSNPIPTARTRLFHPMPHVLPPAIPEAQPPAEPLELALLRQIVATLPVSNLEEHWATINARKTKAK